MISLTEILTLYRAACERKGIKILHENPVSLSINDYSVTELAASLNGVSLDSVAKGCDGFGEFVGLQKVTVCQPYLTDSYWHLVL